MITVSHQNDNNSATGMYINAKDSKMSPMLTPQTHQRHMGTSYKFQRLREKLRQAIVSGELNGKLPGERELARRFHVNAKTLSKALTDLAAEGLLERNIGRGTFVKGAAEPQKARGPWLLIVDAQADSVLVRNLQNLNPQAQLVEDTVSLRPSYLNQFAAVVDLAAETPESFLRDLLVRNVPVVAVGREPRTYSTNTVLLDATLGATQLTRELVLGGHRKFLAVEGRNRKTISDAIRQTGLRYSAEVSVDVCFPQDVVAAREYGATACICDSVQSACQTLKVLEDAGISAPAQMSVAAVGWSGEEYPCTGYYVHSQLKASAVAEILRVAQPGRPTSLWLTGAMVDRGTTAPLGADVAREAQIVTLGSFPTLSLASRTSVG